MKKTDRQTVFNKFGGRCAYCGCELTKGWHVDEIEPVIRTVRYLTDETGRNIYDYEKHEYKKEIHIEHPENFHMDNQYPACASCNITKHCMSLESFREVVQGFISSLNKYTTQYKVAKRYGLIEETKKSVLFYFETYTPQAE